MNDKSVIKYGAEAIETLKRKALTVGRIHRIETSPGEAKCYLSGDALAKAWEDRSKAFRCISYNNLVRQVNAAERLLAAYVAGLTRPSPRKVEGSKP